jgi:hypothetical protein
VQGRGRERMQQGARPAIFYYGGAAGADPGFANRARGFESLLLHHRCGRCAMICAVPCQGTAAGLIPDGRSRCTCGICGDDLEGRIAQWQSSQLITGPIPVRVGVRLPVGGEVWLAGLGSYPGALVVRFHPPLPCQPSKCGHCTCLKSRPTGFDSWDWHHMEGSAAERQSGKPGSIASGPLPPVPAMRAAPFAAFRLWGDDQPSKLRRWVRFPYAAPTQVATRPCQVRKQQIERHQNSCRPS